MVNENNNKGESQMSKPQIRRSMNKAIAKILKPTYFKEIPLEKIDDALRSHGFALVQEDSTLFSGWLTGNNGHDLFDVGVYHDGMGPNDILEATTFVLSMSWHRMGSGRWEVIGYIS